MTKRFRFEDEDGDGFNYDVLDNFTDDYIGYITFDEEVKSEWIFEPSDHDNNNTIMNHDLTYWDLIEISNFLGDLNKLTEQENE